MAVGLADWTVMTMAGYVQPRIAADHALYLAELREDGAIGGRPVQFWEETEVGGWLLLRVLYKSLSPRHAPLAIFYAFSAQNVRYLEGLEENDDDE
jgi:hypothetical protein